MYPVQTENFPQFNLLYTYAEGFDLPTHVIYKTDADGAPLIGPNGKEIVDRVISKWAFSKEDLDFVRDNGFIYLSIIGGQPPVGLFAEPFFLNEQVNEVPRGYDIYYIKKYVQPFGFHYIEQLLQCLRIVFDGDLISKSHRDKLVELDFIQRANGWNIITINGIKYLESLGLIHP